MSCLYCGKKRGLSFFRKDEFCSAEHRKLWQERESLNLVQRLTEAPERRERESLRLPQRPSVDSAPAQIPAPKGVKQVEGATPAKAPSPDVQIVISRKPYVAPVTEPPRPAPPEPKAADIAPPQSLEPQAPVVRKVTPVRTVHTRPETPRISHGEVRPPASSGGVPAEPTAGQVNAGGCLYCGKKRGLFSRDNFCSAEHRQLWQERESSNLVQRLLDAGGGGEREPLRIPKRFPADTPSGENFSLGSPARITGFTRYARCPPGRQHRFSSSRR